MQIEYEEKPWEYFDTAKQDRGKNKPTISQHKFTWNKR